jgi:CRP-like cAMP-binding protein
MRETESGQTIVVEELKAGDFFGEMSLLTGERRRLSAEARIDSEVVVVDKAALAPLLAANEKMVEALSMALAVRVKQTAEQVALAAESQDDQASPQPTALRDRMRGIFGNN